MCALVKPQMPRAADLHAENMENVFVMDACTRVQKNPVPDDVEYYNNDEHDPALRSRIDENYSQNYEVEVRKADNKSAQQSGFGVYTPELRDYTLKEEFRDPFKTLPKVSITAGL